jgi:drug/metabolite transporter (DMT)-like permease
MWAIYTVSSKLYGVASLHATAIVSVFSVVLYVPVYVALQGDAILGAPLHDIAIQAVYQGIFVSTIALFFFSKAVFYLGPSLGSTFAALVPAAAVVLAGVVLGEQPTPLAIAGLAVVTLGMALTLVRRPPRAPATAGNTKAC